MTSIHARAAAAWVYIALRDGGGLGLDGGLLRFWIGEYDDPDGPGPNNAVLAFYYPRRPRARVARAPGRCAGHRVGRWG